MKTEAEIMSLLIDIETVLGVGQRLNDIPTESEKKAQIDILKWILE